MFRTAVRELRKRRGWSQAELADRLHVDRSTVTQMENGRRAISLDEAFAYTGALGVHPMRMMAPLDNTPVEVFPGELVEGHIFRAWLRSQAHVRPDDAEYFPAEVDPDEWRSREDTTIGVVFHRHRELLEAISDAVDPESEAAEMVRGCIAAANEALQDWGQAMAERQNPRPTARQRVCNAA